MNKSTILFLFKNGLIPVSFSSLIIQYFLVLFEKDGNLSKNITLFFIILSVNTVFFSIILLQERKRRLNQEELLEVFINSNQALLILDKDKNIVSINKAGRELFGIDEVINASFCNICDVHHGKGTFCNKKKCFLNDQKENPITVYVKYKSNLKIPVNASIFTNEPPGNKKTMGVILQKTSKQQNEEKKKIERMITHSAFMAQEKERKRISRELHDGIGQALYAILLHIELVRSINSTGKEIGAHLDKLQEITTQTLKDVRNLSSELRPSSLDDYGLRMTLKNFSEELGNRFGTQMNFKYKSCCEHRLPSDIEIGLYRIAQEALINAVKYSKADRIDIVVEREKEFICLSIIDYGEGFILTREHKGVGIYSMEERASLLKGKFSIISKIGQGTEVKVKIPIQQGD